MRASDLFGSQFHTAVVPVAWATAATVSELAAFRCPHDLRVNSVKFVPTTAVVGHGTNFIGIEVRNRGAAGTGTTSVAQKDFDTVTTDDIAAFDEADVTISATSANRNASEGDILAIRKTVGGTGESGDGVIVIEYVSN